MPVKIKIGKRMFVTSITVAILLISITGIFINNKVGVTGNPVGAATNQYTILDSGVTDLSNYVPVKQGTIAPDLSLQSTDGRTISLSSIVNQNKSLILITLTPGCPSCTIILNSIKDIYSKYKDKVFLLGIDIDVSDTTGYLKSYFDDLSNRGKITPYAHYALANYQIIKDYGIAGTEMVYLIDSRGVLRQVISAPYDSQTWGSIFDKMAQV